SSSLRMGCTAIAASLPDTIVFHVYFRKSIAVFVCCSKRISVCGCGFIFLRRGERDWSPSTRSHPDDLHKGRRDGQRGASTPTTPTRGSLHLAFPSTTPASPQH